MHHSVGGVSSTAKNNAQRPLLAAGIRGGIAALGLLGAVIFSAHWLAGDRIETMLPIDGGAEHGAVAATLKGVALVYADGLTMVARRYAQGGLDEEARSLLERVVLIRERILPGDHPDLLEAEALLRQATGETAPASESQPVPTAK